MSTAITTAIVTKSQYAALRNVSPGRVSQWISEGRIEGTALVGTGRNAKISVVSANLQLSRCVDLTSSSDDAAIEAQAEALAAHARAIKLCREALALFEGTAISLRQALATLENVKQG